MYDHNLHLRHETAKTDNDRRYEEIEALAKKAIRGDNDALYELCEKHARSILFRAKYMLGNEMDAEDVAQNVLLRVCENIKDLRKPKAFHAWLSRIIVNETRRYMAARTKRGQVEDIDDYMEELVEDDAQLLPGEYLEGLSVHDAIMEIVSRLPARQREAILLHYYDELKVTEVGKAMGIPHQSASRYLLLAREKLRADLEARGLEIMGLEGTGRKNAGLEDAGLETAGLEITELGIAGHEDPDLEKSGHEKSRHSVCKGYGIKNIVAKDNYRYVS